MGKMQRTKGHAFERKIAAELRELWPEADVHRSSQADRARESDVVIDGRVPALARMLWLELQDARMPDPEGKMAQATHDTARHKDSRFLPIVVWHRLNARRTNVTLSLWALVELAAVG